MSKKHPILVTDVRPGGSGPIKELECWSCTEIRKSIGMYDTKKWLGIERVKTMMLQGQEFVVARLEEDDGFTMGGALELVLKTEGNRKGWDNLKTLQRKHRD